MGLFNWLFGKKDNALLENMIKDGAFLVDVRTPLEYSQGHVKGSVNIPLDKILVNATQFKNKKNCIVFCRSGARAAQAKRILDKMGVANVANAGTWEYINGLLNN
ncbi:rhodanese-like domain-containing protein [Parasediminibacterium sp. JCM 36343]|uniref:rhodanese-like domain-containing protein n=1 Tax=Parasediminibacterium sp. JCM 36343 TaxID=3374279 RepID=UPI00397DCCB3